MENLRGMWRSSVTYAERLNYAKNAAYSAVSKKYKIPGSRGRLIADHSHKPEIKSLMERINTSSRLGFHGTAWHRVKDQVERGFLEDRGKRVYFENDPDHHTVLLYAQEMGSVKGDSVILEIVADDKDVIPDEAFATICFKPGAKIHVVRAYELNPELDDVPIEILSAKVLNKLNYFAQVYFDALKKGPARLTPDPLYGKEMDSL